MGRATLYALVACTAIARSAGATEPARMATLGVVAQAGAESCGNVHDLEALVEGILGRRVFVVRSSESAVTIDVEYTARNGGLEARISVRGDKQGVRVLRDSDPTCRALTDAVAAAVALLLDNALAAQPRPPAKSERSEFALGIQGAAGLSLGVVGGPAAELGGSLRAFFGRAWSLSAGVAGSTEHRNPIGPGAVDVRWLGGFFRGCGVVAELGPSIGLCVGPTMGRMYGRGDGFPIQGAASLAWLTMAAGPELRFDVASGVYVGASVDAVVPIFRQSFSIGHLGEAYVSPAVAGVASLEVGWSFLR